MKQLLMGELLVLFSLLFYTHQSFAANASGGISVQVLEPLSILQTTSLNFGSFSSSSSSGTIDQDGVVTGGVTAITNSETRTPSIFAISGDSSNSNTTYFFTLPSAVILNNGGNSMTANLSFADNGTGSRVLDNAGNDNVIINGVLEVAANQATGSYNGNYVVTVAYD